jgi:hypothetical protein
MAGFSGMRRAAVTGLAVAIVTSAAARPATAQGLGIGPRMVFVTGADSPLQDPASDSKTKLTGGFLRIRASKHVGVEASMDFRTATDAANTIKVHSTPIQGSALFYLLKGPLSPYAIAGVGWYKTRVEVVGADRSTETAETRFGYHTGFGGELMLGRHASIYVDYRYTFVNIQGLGGLLNTATSLLSMGSLSGLFSSLSNASGATSTSSSTNPNVSHLGSMWTTGVTLYF